MNVEYKELSVVGKVWSLAELINAGIRDKKKSYILAAVRKVEALNDSEEIDASMAVDETIDNIVEHINSLKKKYIDHEDCDVTFVSDDSIASQIWKNRFMFDKIRNNMKIKDLSKVDKESLDKVFSNINRLYIQELKMKNLSGIERKDLFKIRHEILSMKTKYENITARGI